MLIYERQHFWGRSVRRLHLGTPELVRSLTIISVLALTQMNITSRDPFRDGKAILAPAYEAGQIYEVPTVPDENSGLWMPGWN